jgi:hypothetical protein
LKTEKEESDAKNLTYKATIARCCEKAGKLLMESGR